MHWFFLATMAAVGAVIGSFLNVVIHRGPAMWRLVESDSRRGDLISPRSYCPECGAQIKIIHLIPIVSYVWLRKKCAACGAPIRARYFMVEMLGALAGATAFLLFGLTWQAGAAAVFFWFLIALAAIDWETGYLPDALTLPLVAIGLGANLAHLFVPLLSALIGASAGYAVFRLFGAIFFKLRKIEGLGQGDAKLLAGIGAWLGWAALAPVVFVAALVGLGGALVMKLSGRAMTRETPIPFGPALAVAAALSFILGAAAPADAWWAAGLFPTYP